MENQEQSDYEKLRDYIKSSLAGELGEVSQEEMIIQVFEGEFRHKLGTMNVVAGHGVGAIGKRSDSVIWG